MLGKKKTNSLFLQRVEGVSGYSILNAIFDELPTVRMTQNEVFIFC